MTAKPQSAVAILVAARAKIDVREVSSGEGGCSIPVFADSGGRHSKCAALVPRECVIGRRRYFLGDELETVAGHSIPALPFSIFVLGQKSQLAVFPDDPRDVVARDLVGG